MSNETVLRESLTVLLQQSVKGFQEISSLNQLTAGASKQTFKLKVATEAGSKTFAYRRNGPEDAGDHQVAQITLATEAKLISLAQQYQVPAPNIVATHLPKERVNASHEIGFLMEWLNGETLGYKIVRAKELAAVRQNLASQCGEILGRIHSIDWRKAGLKESLPLVNPKQLVDDTWARYVAYGVPQPMIDYSWRWLRDNIPETSRQTLVHGDFRNGNLMVNKRGINAVLDWELAHIGDPIRDLGWLCVNSWRFGIVDKEVGGFGAVDALLDAYEKTTQVRVSHPELKFWQVFGSFWWSTTTLLMANSWRTGANKSLERPAIGRRSSEAQMDCVNLLLPSNVQLRLPEGEHCNEQQLPTRSELLLSVKDFLSDELVGRLDNHDSFMARVGANSLDIVERELTYGPSFTNDEALSLRNLLNGEASLIEMRAKLSQELRDGLSLETVELQEHLRSTTAKQLYIDQPNYSALNAVFI